MSVYLGCDIGTVGLKGAVVVDDIELAGHVRDLKILTEHSLSGKLNGPLQGAYFFLAPYRRITGNPVDAARDLVSEMSALFPEERLLSVALTGSGSKLSSELLGYTRYSDFKSIAHGIGAFHPDVELILEMGGESSRFLRLQRDPEGSRVGIADYDSNGDCAAGTGSFLDQQSSRLCCRVEEIGDLTASTDTGSKIAGRCSVFAKSDMIHAQQKGATPPQILKGLCEAVARNFKGSVAKGRELTSRTAFVGGVASNSGVCAAMRDVFGVENGRFMVPDHPAFYGALGSALLGRASIGTASAPVKVKSEFASIEKAFPAWPPLSLDKVRILADEIDNDIPRLPDDERGLPIKAFLGLDIGSVSTNLVLMNEQGVVLHEIYLRTRGRPVEVVRQGLREMAEKFGDSLIVCGVGTTGSGRELVGELVGADTVNDEITAHKTGAALVARKYLPRSVDSILEIGGQDSKFISLQKDVVVDFTMNEACAAGTGSFLEEQAEKLDINIIDEFAARAMASDAPLRLGERCTVYMEMDVTSSLREGAEKNDVVAGLAYSVVQNYLNRVVRNRPIGDVIFFQGGTAYNRAVAAAFASVLDKTIIVPPHNGVMGAYGAALLAAKKSARTGKSSRFRGFDLDRVHYEVREFTCNACSNQCDIQEFSVEGVKTYWGDKCSDRFRKQVKVEKKPAIDDLFLYRQQALEKDWLPGFIDGEQGDDYRRLALKLERYLRKSGSSPRFGMLRAMYYYQRHPFWNTYIKALGGAVVTSGNTDKAVVHAGIENTVAEPCFPIQVAHGHMVELAKQDVDYLLVPSQINETTNELNLQSHVCPFGQVLPYQVKHSPAINGAAGKLLTPYVHFRQGQLHVEQQLWEQIGKRFVGRHQHRLAVTLAMVAQECFRDAVAARGKAALAEIERRGESYIVLIGRPYNIYDPGLNLNLAGKLRQLYGMNVIPLDFIPSDDVDISELNSNMFWSYGRKILQTVLWSRQRPNCHLIYLTNFMCGPDSFVKSFAAEGADKPLLTLQFDGHGNDAGMMTRCEAYLDSKGMIQ